MEDFPLTINNLNLLFDNLQDELKVNPSLVVSVKKDGIGKWGLAKLWRLWMSKTADYMANNGVTMPLCIKSDGETFGKRPFNSDDAHELFTALHLGVDAQGVRLSWAKSKHDGMRTATKGERLHAMMEHEIFCATRGIILFNPRDSEYYKLKQEQNK